MKWRKKPVEPTPQPQLRLRNVRQMEAKASRALAINKGRIESQPSGYGTPRQGGRPG